MSIDPKPTCLVFKKYIVCCIKMFKNLPPSVKKLKNDRAKFKKALRKYLHILMRIGPCINLIFE